MGRGNVEEVVRNLVSEIVQGTELEVYDVEFVKEHDWILRVYIEKQGGIGIEDCQWVSTALDKKLDEVDPIQQSYYLEVSSPGIDRPLKKEADFVRYAGDQVDVHTYKPISGKKLITGELVGLREQSVVLLVNNEEVAIERSEIAQVRLHVEF